MPTSPLNGSRADETADHTVGSVSHTGRRDHNEDTVYVRTAEVEGVSTTLLVVADGMGGHRGGAAASAAAAAAFEAGWERVLALEARPDARTARAFLSKTVENTQRRIAEAASSDEELEDMGTTVVAALVVGRGAVVANVGDSRAYLVERDDIAQLTDDHSAVMEAVRSGSMTEEEALQSPYRNALTRFLDGSGDVEVDLFPPEEGFRTLPPNARLLLCSDGLHGALTDLEIFEEVSLGRPPPDAAEALVRHAYHAGSRDNITAAVLEFGGSRDTPAAAMPPPIPEKHPLTSPPEPEPEPGQSHRRFGARALVATGLLSVLLVVLLAALLWNVTRDESSPGAEEIAEADERTERPRRASLSARRDSAGVVAGGAIRGGVDDEGPAPRNMDPETRPAGMGLADERELGADAPEGLDSDVNGAPEQNGADEPVAEERSGEALEPEAEQPPDELSSSGEDSSGDEQPGGDTDSTVEDTVPPGGEEGREEEAPASGETENPPAETSNPFPVFPLTTNAPIVLSDSLLRGVAPASVDSTQGSGPAVAPRPAEAADENAPLEEDTLPADSTS